MEQIRLCMSVRLSMQQNCNLKVELVRAFNWRMMMMMVAVNKLGIGSHNQQQVRRNLFNYQMLTTDLRAKKENIESVRAKHEKKKEKKSFSI